jgi:GDP-fucose transporter C1
MGISDNAYSSYNVVSVITAYWVVSISMVYLNKLMLSDENASIPAPLFITWFQCIITCVICVVLGKIGERTRAANQESYFNEYPVIVFDFTASKGVLPLSLAFVGMIALNNICLQLVEVSFCKYINR